MPDMTEIAALLSIVNDASAHSGKLSGIVGYAMDRLLEINAELREEQMEKAAAQAQEEAEAQAKRDADARAAAEEESVDNGGRFSLKNQNPKVERKV